jgi:membrane dipeptidase
MGIFLGNNDICAETFADHVCYVAELAGPEHVGFGLDFKPAQKDAADLTSILASRPDYWPAGQRYDTPDIKLFSPANMAEVLCLLRQRGWSDSELHGFLGGNFRRVAEQVWHE